MERLLSESFESHSKSALRNLKSAILLCDMFLALCSMLLAPRFPVEAQQPGKVSRIGYLTGSSLSANPAWHEAFRQGMRELGYVEGENIIIEWRSGEGNAGRVPTLVANLIGLKVDLIVTVGSGDTRAAKEMTGIIPIVMVQAGDPVGSGFIASLARLSDV